MYELYTFSKLLSTVAKVNFVAKFSDVLGPVDPENDQTFHAQENYWVKYELSNCWWRHILYDTLPGH